MTWQTPVFLIVATCAFGIASLRVLRLIRLMKAHTGKAPTYGDWGTRAGLILKNVLGQQAVLRKPGIGIAHALIFWGFLVITVGTLEQFLSTIHQDWTFEFVGEGLYNSFLFLHDLFTVLVLSAVGYACYRRFVVRPDYLG